MRIRDPLVSLERSGKRSGILAILAAAIACGGSPGDNPNVSSQEEADPILDEERAAQVSSASEMRTCAIAVEGRAHCWGHAGWGAMGFEPGADLYRPRPTEVTDKLTFAAIASGRDHTCALTPDGAAYCWGSNNSGQLGIGEVDPGFGENPNPRRVVGGLAFTRIDAGIDQTCALTSDGAAYCWGGSGSGKLGDGVDRSRRSAPEPVAVAGGHRFTALSVGTSHACAITTDQELYCWGSSSMGQIGDGGFEDRRAPVRVAERLRFVAVGAGHDNSCAVSTEGSTYCWGDGRWGQLGDGGPIEDRVELLPVRVDTGETFTRVSVGSAFACALNDERRAYCWGSNLAGEVGRSPDAVDDDCFGDPCSRRPVAVSGDNDFVGLAVGGYHACGLTPGGRILCWGNNENGALGRGTVDSGIHPAPRPLLETLLFGRVEE